MNTFYSIDSTRISHLEFFWWYKSPLVLIGWMLKWLRVPTSCSSDDPNTESTLPFVVVSLPAEIAAGFEPLTNDLAALGFCDPVYHAIHDDGTRTTIYWATFRHESGNHFARIHKRLWQQAPNPNRACSRCSSPPSRTAPFSSYRNLRMFFIPLFGAAVTGRTPSVKLPVMFGVCCLALLWSLELGIWSFRARYFIPSA